MAEKGEGSIPTIGGHADIDEIKRQANLPRNTKSEQYLARIAEASEKSAESGEIPPLPHERERQRESIIGLVEQIESNDAPIVPLPGFSLANERPMVVINSYLSKDYCDLEIKKEAIARLRLQNCFAIATAIPGRSQDAAIFLLQSFQQAESKKWGLEGQDFSLLLKERPSGLRVGEAFLQLQIGYTKGIKLGDNQTVVELGSDKESAENIEAAYKMIENHLGGGKEAQKSVQLASRIAKATLETSVWNTELAGGDPLAEAIYFRLYRTKRQNLARDRGPDITIDRIEGFGTSYFRNAQILDQIQIDDLEHRGQKIRYPDGRERNFNKYLFLPQPEMHPAYITRMSDPAKRELAMMLRNRVGVKDEKGRDVTNLMEINELNFNRIRRGDYAGWLGNTVPKILAFKSLLLQTTWTPKDINSDAVEGWVSPAIYADPEEVQRLRAELSLGILGSILFEPEEAVTSGWDALRVGAMIRVMTANFHTKDGTTPAFISRRQMEEIIGEIERYGINFWHVASMIGVRQILAKRGVEV